MNNPVKIVTHSDKYHADDIFSCAIVELALEKEGKTFTVVRTRDEETISQADIAFDIGGIDDPEALRFDHHQKGGAGQRENGIKYAACGLVWKKYGKELCSSDDVARKIDEKLIQAIDADDNGQELVESTHEATPYFLQDFLYVFRPTWKEDVKKNDESFFELVPIAKKIIDREIFVETAISEAFDRVKDIYNTTDDKRLIVVDDNYPFEQILPEFPEPLFIVRPRPGGTWGLNAIPKQAFSFENRKNLPAGWAGLKNEELVAVTGIDDAIFCHNGLFLAVTKTKEGALALAKIALES
jgi:uncharacterized UPF0160 family protein